MAVRATDGEKMGGACKRAPVFPILPFPFSDRLENRFSQVSDFGAGHGDTAED
jgi:hypothetical protein